MGKLPDIKDNANIRRDTSYDKAMEMKFNLARLLNTNTHIPLLAQLKEDVLSTYKVKAKFTYLGYNGDTLYCNGQKLVYAKDKFDYKLYLGINVTLIETNLHSGGSNAYPRITCWKTGDVGYCILEFISFGLPYIDPLNGWDIEVIELNKI